MQSSIHTKCKPVSLPIAVCAETRMILAVGVASMPAQHPLKQIALRKYGPRDDDRPAAIDAVLQRIRPMLAPRAMITTDKAPRYPGPIARILPGINHVQHADRKARAHGNGELKESGVTRSSSQPYGGDACAIASVASSGNFGATLKRIDRLEDRLFVAAPRCTTKLGSSVFRSASSLGLSSDSTLSRPCSDRIAGVMRVGAVAR